MSEPNTSTKSTKAESKTVAKTAADTRQASIPGAETTESSAAAPATTLTTEQKAALGKAFLEAREKVVRAQDALEKARAEKSATVEAIVKGLGHKGPYTIGDKRYKAAKGKGEGNETWTMREDSPSKENL